MNQDSIDTIAARLDEDLIALRRDLHAHPEEPGQEARTAAIVAERLTAAGLSVTTGVGGHGVVAILKGDRPGRTVAYRADMDAVPAHAQVGGGTGPAHLCGHDVHTTVGVGVAQTLAKLRDHLSGTIVFIFQPAEETLTGAQAMLDDGVLELAEFEEIHALHCGPLPVGTFAVTPATGLPGQDQGVVTLTGSGARDRAERLVADLGTLATVGYPESPEDLELLIEHLLTPNGSLARFIHIAAWTENDSSDEHAEVRCYYRCWPEERTSEVREAIGRLADAAGAAKVEFPADPFPAMVCPEGDALELQGHLDRVLGSESVQVTHAAFPFNGEDFALFLNEMPGTYSYLGVRAPGAGIATSSPHLGEFDPDERAIGVGVRAMSGWLAERSGTTK